MSAGEVIAVGAGAFVATLVLTPIAARVAGSMGLVDHPGPLKPQRRATPYLGGLAVGCGVAVGAAAFDAWLLIPLGMALGLGTTDDAVPLPALVRLLGQVAAGLMLAAVVSTHFGALGYIVLPVAAVLLANGCNLLDGLDAMCGSVSLVAAGGFCFLLSGDARTFAFAVATAAAAFLVFNRPPAQIYLGDGGSYLLGLCLCALLALAWTPGTPLPTGVGALVLVFVPVAEVLWAAWRRARAGESLLVGDRDHPYDVLIRSGWSVERTVGAYALAGMLLVVVAVGASHLSTPLAWILVGASALGVLAAGVAALPGSRRSRSAGGIAT